MTDGESPFDRAFREIAEAKSANSKHKTDISRWWNNLVNAWRHAIDDITQKNQAKLAEKCNARFFAATSEGTELKAKVSVGLSFRSNPAFTGTLPHIPELTFKMNSDGNAKYDAGNLKDFESGEIPLDDQDYYNKLEEVLARYVSAAVRSTIK